MFTKYNNLKCKPKPAVKVINIIENLKKATYDEILRVNIKPAKTISKTDNTDCNIKPNIQEKHRSLSPTSRYKRI